MRYLNTFCLSVITLAAFCSFAYAAGEIEKGKVLFNDAHFSGGTKACSSCHPNGQGLEKAADKKEFHIMGKTQKGLEEAINFCIVNASQGKAIDVKSAQMKEMVAYIKSLKPKKAAAGY